MPAAAPEHEQRPRLAHWLLAGAAIGAVAAGLAAAAWRWLPSVAPIWVVVHSPWTGPAVRAALAWDARYPKDEDNLLSGWAELGSDRCDSLAPYLASSDRRTRKVAVMALAGLTPHSSATETALLLLLNDPDPDIRRAAVSAVIDPASIPALQAHGHDPELEVALALAQTLERLQRR